MQKKKIIVLAAALLVLFSTFQLTDLLYYHSKVYQESTIVHMQYLLLAHGLFLIMLLGFYLFEDFQINLLIAFLFCLLTTVAFILCNNIIAKLPPQHQTNYLTIHKANAYEKSMQKNYLSLFSLVFMYSVIGCVILGVFLLIRFLLVKWYQRRLGIELQAQVQIVPYSSELKGKDCTICLNEFEPNNEDFYQLRNCHHIYHSKCIREWVNYSRTCPICRYEIFPIRRGSQSM